MRKLLSVLLVLTAFSSAYPQKLPKVQTVSVRAPATIKIDGKATEWNDKLQAYNTAAGLFYTISNDDDMLYLTIRSDDPITLFKINCSGIIFNINSTQKNDRDAISINYPFYEDGKFPYINLNEKIKIDNTPQSVRLADSAMSNINKRINDCAKFIKITGLSNADTLLPIYNDIGIMAAQGYSNMLIYTQEMAIPLKLLKLKAKSLSKFNYHLIVPKVRPNFMESTTKIGNDNVLTVTFSARSIQAIPQVESKSLTTVTDFFGEYTLAK